MLEFAPGSSEFRARWRHWFDMFVALYNATKTTTRLTSDTFENFKETKLKKNLMIMMMMKSNVLLMSKMRMKQIVEC